MQPMKCALCNYETTKTFNFKRHLERCTRSRARDALLEPSATRSPGPAPRESFVAPFGSAGHVQNSEALPANRSGQFTGAHIATRTQDVANSEGQDWEPPAPSTAHIRSGHPLDRDPTLVSTPVSKRHRADAGSLDTNTRRQTAPSSLMSLTERDYLVARIDELENMVMRLQRAVCVMDSRMQQFRMATSSWQPVSSDD